jgi:hypothetical protein
MSVCLFFSLTHDFSSDPLWQGGLDSHLMKEKSYKANLNNFTWHDEYF